jgi:hypothetical protein
MNGRSWKRADRRRSSHHDAVRRQWLARIWTAQCQNRHCGHRARWSWARSLAMKRRARRCFHPVFGLKLPYRTDSLVDLIRGTQTPERRFRLANHFHAFLPIGMGEGLRAFRAAAHGKFPSGNRPTAFTLYEAMRKTPLWTTEHEADFIRLANLGYSANRLHFKRPIPFLLPEQSALGIAIVKPFRLPPRERSAESVQTRMIWPKTTNSA